MIEGFAEGFKGALVTTAEFCGFLIGTIADIFWNLIGLVILYKVFRWLMTW